MTGLRSWTKSHRALALWLIVIALAVKAFVPQGYMIMPGKTLTVALCSGMGPAEMTITLPMDASKGDQHPERKAQDQVCSFSVLGHAAAPAIDAVLLLAAIAFVLALGFAPRLPPRLRRRAFLQPPLRGPPTLA
jgi:hypothetical protein